MIPEAKKTAVAHALQTTFGTSDFENVSLLTVGLSSALIFKIVVLGRPYLLRIITRTDAMSDPAQWFGCMELAAEAGLAPRIWYKSVEDRISITDFIEAKAFPLIEARAKLPGLLKRLHSLPAFPFRVNYLDAVDGFVKKFRASKILPKEMTDELFHQYEKLTGVYPRNSSDLVSCHNDLKPENILFDGDRVWLVDWEAAFLNDRYADLVVAANFLVTTDNEEDDYLKSYFGKDISEYHRARFFLMRQVLHMSYFTFFMNLCFNTGKEIDFNSAKPGFRDFHARMWAGEINLANDDARQQYAWVHFEQLRHNLGLKRFDDSLRIVMRKENSK